MEALVTIVEVGAYSERQYQRQDGTAEYFKSRGKNRDTQYYQNQPYIVRGSWKQRVWGDNNDRHENVLYLSDIQSL